MVAELIRVHGRALVLSEIRLLLSELREAMVAKRPTPPTTTDEHLVAALRRRIAERSRLRLKRVFNLTGTVLHTNLGRALLSREAIDHVVAVMGEPCNLEFDLTEGGRGDRDSLVEDILCDITGAEAATVVNNNAGAVLLVVAALARRRQVIISRGELVEIGGAFRIPDVMASAGAKLVEVGTTNRTHPGDIERAINSKTGLIMKVHASNYKIEGFSSSVPESEIVRIAHENGIPFAFDLGGGSLVDLSAYGLPKEPMPQEALRAGVDVVTFSGDKLLGGPQAGLIVGKKAVIDRIKKHPLRRALRPSKMTLAAIESTLRLYGKPAELSTKLPTLALLTRKADELKEVAVRLFPRLAEALGRDFVVELEPAASQVGSGSLPMDLIPSFALCISSAAKKGSQRTEINGLAKAFRALPIPVIGRMRENRIILDMRCLTDERVFVDQLICLFKDAEPFN
jgi:L-seryl-tRNA(Ser) seleniumtransferase